MRETDRQTDTQTERNRDRDKQTHRQKWQERDSDRERDREAIIPRLSLSPPSFSSINIKFVLVIFPVCISLLSKKDKHLTSFEFLLSSDLIADSVSRWIRYLADMLRCDRENTENMKKVNVGVSNKATHQIQATYVKNIAVMLPFSSPTFLCICSSNICHQPAGGGGCACVCVCARACVRVSVCVGRRVWEGVGWMVARVWVWAPLSCVS